MPIYEYRCQVCRRRFSVFWRTFSAAEQGQPVCKHCGSGKVTRLMSRVRVLRADDRLADDLSDPDMLGDFDENDPRSVGRFMRKMITEMGDEAGDLEPELEEVVDRLEKGQDPEQIEKEMPDLLGDDLSAGGDADAGL
ncbi:MAG: zinc ribbon domain-containing protein [Anaerolineae bacterium]|nr:zinc ribbon domain-containing protein [Anaerolineae bacterium]